MARSVICVVLLSLAMQTYGITSEDSKLSQTQIVELSPQQQRLNAIRNALQHLPQDELDRLNINLDGPIQEGTDKANMLIEAWKNRQEELKKAVSGIVKPAEYMAKILKVLKESTSEDELMKNLDELENFIEDIDNANDFHTIGGWPILFNLLYKPYATTNVKSKAIWCMGTIVKNNDVYQLWLLETLGDNSLGSHTVLHKLMIELVENIMMFRNRNTYTDQEHMSRHIVNTSDTNIEDNILLRNDTSIQDEQFSDSVKHKLQLDELQLLRHILYTIASGIRGNPDTQEYLHRINISIATKVRDANSGDGLDSYTVSLSSFSSELLKLSKHLRHIWSNNDNDEDETTPTTTAIAKKTKELSLQYSELSRKVYSLISDVLEERRFVYSTMAFRERQRRTRSGEELREGDNGETTSTTNNTEGDIDRGSSSSSSSYETNSIESNTDDSEDSIEYNNILAYLTQLSNNFISQEWLQESLDFAVLLANECGGMTPDMETNSKCKVLTSASHRALFKSVTQSIEFMLENILHLHRHPISQQQQQHDESNMTSVPPCMKSYLDYDLIEGGDGGEGGDFEFTYTPLHMFLPHSCPLFRGQNYDSDLWQNMSQDPVFRVFIGDVSTKLTMLESLIRIIETNNIIMQNDDVE